MNTMLQFLDVPLIKIINGVRRSGKSTLLSLLSEELVKRGIRKECIIYRRYTALENSGVDDAVSMYAELRSKTEGKGRCYLLLDEVQEIDGWEKVVNSLFEDDGHCLYITGSNSKLLAGEFSTYISGRYIEIPVYPLSFDEFREFREAGGIEERDISSYIEYGGFPVISAGNFDSETAYQIIYGIYSSIILRDIQRRHKVTNLDLFSRVVDFMLDNMGKTFSGASVVRFLKGQGRTQNIEQVYDYIRWLEEAFVVFRCQRYDLRGKEILATQEKYYLSDHSLLYGLKGFHGTDTASVIENIVYLELRRRGYNVYIGKLYDKEIDFVAEKGKGLERFYVQVCRNMPTASDREIANLKAIRDDYPKIVVTLDKYGIDNVDGIRIIPLNRFLLEK